MPRARLYRDDDVLDAARDLVLAAGPRAVGVRAIAARTGAPSGSLYHRYRSRDDLVAQAWLRAVRRFQAGFLVALEGDDPRQAAARAAAWAVSFSLRDPADARLLLDHSRSSLLDGDPSPAIAAALETVNRPLVDAVRRLAGRLYGTVGTDAFERVFFAVIDLPCAVVRRHLVAGTLREADAARVASATRDLLRPEIRGRRRRTR